MGARMEGQLTVDGTARFAGDRYQRLVTASRIVAADPAVADAPPPLDAVGLRACVERLVATRILDGLSRREADWVSMVLLVDFCRGPDALSERVLGMDDANPAAVALTAIVAILRSPST